MDPIRFAILTISDSCATGNRKDETGPAIKEQIDKKEDAATEGAAFEKKVLYTAIVPDDKTKIMDYLVQWSDSNKVDVIITTGGTGIAPRDVTPEATKKIIHKEIPGMSMAMIMSSLKTTHMAMLSRGVCGIRRKTLIINLPGSLQGAIQCLCAVAPAIVHVIDLLHNNIGNINIIHKMTSQSRPIMDKDEFIKKMTIATRDRESKYPMISVQNALAIMLETVQQLDTEIVKLTDAYGRKLAEDIKSGVNIPPFRASVKDGYAVLANDGKGKREVLGDLKAGDSPQSNKFILRGGTCVRVNTGAPLPDTATAVVQKEDTELLQTTTCGKEKEIKIKVAPKEGQDIRPLGSDIKFGQLILDTFSSQVLGTTEIGLLAACGQKEVKVVKVPSVGVLSTGNELQEIGMPLRDGQIYDSNRITLLSLLRENGYNSLDFGITYDEEVDLVEKLADSLGKVDVLVTTGSLSMGDRDLLKPLLTEEFGAKIHFGRVNMKPGKPTTFATCVFNGKTKYILCLPGNPVSAFVTAHLFLLPLLSRFQNVAGFLKPLIVKAKLADSYDLDERPEYLNVTLMWQYEESIPLAYIPQKQVSSNILHCRYTNALLVLPARTLEKQMMDKDEFLPAILLKHKLPQVM